MAKLNDEPEPELPTTLAETLKTLKAHTVDIRTLFTCVNALEKRLGKTPVMAFKVIRVHGTSPKALEDALNKLGNEGWQYKYSDEFIAILSKEANQK